LVVEGRVQQLHQIVQVDQMEVILFLVLLHQLAEGLAEGQR
jgi:hypothetical protein